MLTGIISFLIVEDEVLIAMGIEMELINAGFKVCGRVTSGEAAIRAVAELKPDLVLMDIRLSGQLDGIEAAECISADSSAEVIFMSGYQNDEILERAMRLHPRGFLIKPFSLASLRRLFLV